MNAVNRMCYSVLGGMALAIWSAGCAAEPTIPLHISLEILESCTIGSSMRPTADRDAPSVLCSLGTPFMLTHVATPKVPSVTPRDPDGLGAAAWTITF